MYGKKILVIPDNFCFARRTWIMKKKTLAALLMAVMLLGVCALSNQALAVTTPADRKPTNPPTGYNQNQQNQQNRNKSVTKYSLWIGGKQVTSDNLSGDGWRYDPKTNTLTLNGFSYSGTGRSNKYQNGTTCYTGICYEGDKTLNIVLSGENSLKIQDVNKAKTEIDAILCRGNLVFSGDGSLSVKAGACGSSSYSIGIWCGKDITFAGGTVNTEGSKAEFSHGVSCSGQIKVTGGTLQAKSGASDGSSISVWCGKDFSIHSGKVTLASGTAKEYNSYGLYVQEGSVTVEGGTFEAQSGDAGDWSAGIWCAKGFALRGGEVTLAGNTAKNNSYGLFVYEGDLNVEGGNLRAVGGSALWSVGIECRKKVTVLDGTVYAAGGSLNFKGQADYCGSLGINSDGLSVQGGDVTAEGGEAKAVSSVAAYSLAIQCTQNIVIGGGKVHAEAKAVSGSEGSSSQGFTSSKDIIISGGSVTAVGQEAPGDSYGIWNDGMLEIGSGVTALTVSGFDGAISGKVKTQLGGTGWSDVSGTEGKTAIRAGKEAQELSFLKVEFAPVGFSFK